MALALPQVVRVAIAACIVLVAIAPRAVCGSCDNMMPGDAGGLPSVPPLPQVHHAASTMPSSTMYSGNALAIGGHYWQTDSTCFNNAFTPALPPSLPPTLPPTLPPSFQTLGGSTADSSGWCCDAGVASFGFPSHAQAQPHHLQHQQQAHQVLQHQLGGAPYYQQQVLNQAMHAALQPCHFQQQIVSNVPQLQQYAEHVSNFAQHVYSSTGPGGVSTSVATVIAQTPALAPVLPTSANTMMPPPPGPPLVPAHAAEPAPPQQPPTVPVISECTLPRIRI